MATQCITVSRLEPSNHDPSTTITPSILAYECCDPSPAVIGPTRGFVLDKFPKS